VLRKSRNLTKNKTDPAKLTTYQSDARLFYGMPYLIELAKAKSWSYHLRLKANLRAVIVAWYRKTQPTFADTLAAVRKEIWAAQGFSISRIRSDSRKLPSRLREGIAYALCHAA
jgi:hypothetical protein